LLELQAGVGGGLFALSLKGDNRVSAHRPAAAKLEIQFQSGEKRHTLLTSYYDLVRAIREEDSLASRRALVGSLVDRIRKNNPIYYEKKKLLFLNLTRISLKSEFHLLASLVNAAIFLPLNAHANGFHERKPGEQGGLARGWVQFDPSTWKGNRYLNQPIWRVISYKGEKMNAMQYGIGVIDLTSSREHAENILFVMRHETKDSTVLLQELKREVGFPLAKAEIPFLLDRYAPVWLNRILDPLKRDDETLAVYRDLIYLFYEGGKRSMSQDLGFITKGCEINQRQAIDQFLKGDAFARCHLIRAQGPIRLVMINGHMGSIETPGKILPPIEPTPDLIVRCIVRPNSPLAKYKNVIPLVVESRLSGVLESLAYLQAQGKHDLALFFFLEEMDFIIPSLHREPYFISSAIHEIFGTVGIGSRTELMQWIGKGPSSEKVERAMSFLRRVLATHFLTYEDRYRSIYRKAPPDGLPEMQEIPLSLPPVLEGGPRSTPAKREEPLGPVSGGEATPIERLASEANDRELDDVNAALQQARTLSEQRQPLEALEVLLKHQNGKSVVDPRVRDLGKEIVPMALSEAVAGTKAALDISLPEVWDPSGNNVFVSGLVNAIRAVAKIRRETPFALVLFNDSDRASLSAEIDTLRSWLLMAINDHIPSGVPKILLQNADAFDLTQEERDFLFHYVELSSPGAPPSLYALQRVLGGDEESVLRTHEALIRFVENENVLALRYDDVEQSEVDQRVGEVTEDDAGGLVVNHYPVFVDSGCPKITVAQDITSVLLNALKKVTRHAKDGVILKSRDGMYQENVFQQGQGDYDLFAQVTDGKVIVLWFGPKQKSHATGGRSKWEVDQLIIESAKKMDSTKWGRLKSDFSVDFKPGAEFSPATLSAVMGGGPGSLMALLGSIPVSLLAAWAGFPFWVGAGLSMGVALGIGLRIPIRRWWGKPSPAMARRDVRAALAEILSLAETSQGAAAHQMIALLNDLPPDLRVESLGGPGRAGAPSSATGSEIFRRRFFPSPFGRAMGGPFPDGVSLVRARQILCAWFRADGAVIPGMSLGTELEKGDGLVAIISREMGNDLASRVAAFQRAAARKPVVWLAEDGAVRDALRPLLPENTNVSIPRNLIVREKGVVVISGKSLESSVREFSILPEFAIALPRGAQVDMSGVGDNSALRAAVFMFLDLLGGSDRMDFATLQTIDRVARLIATSA
jgi:hypothetical protein